jgi:eukaryotic-like serine/threonine-protein kinase
MASDLARLSALLDEALDRPEDERAAWLAGRTDLADAVRSQLRQLLADGAPGMTLPPLPAYREDDLAVLADPGEPADPDEAGDLAADSQVGPYRLIRELGRGGMGSVWLAERSDGVLKRQVALKLPHSHLPQRRLEERFARERDILAGLVHPHIARLYDAGLSPEGQPYLALEYVEGQTLTDYCRTQHLELAARLDLFLQVLRAIQYAHSQLIVHRDLKPGNILVTEEGEVRLLDFGIAKLLDDPVAHQAQLTEAGDRLLTPHYAAPEQLLGQAIGTGADLYALGVVLYELLAGTLPYRLKRDTRGALEEAILVDAVVLPSQAARDNPEAIHRAKRLKGDLDTIILKALKKAPADRYATAAAFADDIGRYLKGEPVLAQADSAWYRAGKFLSRHRLGVAAGMLVIVALAGGMAAALWQAGLAREQEMIARKEARTAQAVKEFMQGIFLANSAQQGDPIKARQTTARELLDIGAGKIDEALADAPEAKLEMLQIYSELYSQLLLADKATAFAERRLDLVREREGATSLALVEALLSFATACRIQWLDDPRQWSAIQEAMAILDRRGEASPLQRSVALAGAAEYWSDRDFRRSLGDARRAMAIHRGQEESDSNAKRAAVIELLAGNHAEARVVAQDGLDQGRAYAEEMLHQGKAGEGDFLSKPLLLDLLAEAEWGLGNQPAAESRWRAALAAALATYGAVDPDTARIQSRLAAFLLAMDRAAEARPLIEQAAATLANGRPDDRTKLRYEALAALGRTQADVGQHQAALATLVAALAMREPTLYASLAIAGVLRDQARALAGLGRRDEAAKVLARAVAMREKAGIRPSGALREEGELTERLRIAR